MKPERSEAERAPLGGMGGTSPEALRDSLVPVWCDHCGHEFSVDPKKDDWSHWTYCPRCEQRTLIYKDR